MRRSKAIVERESYFGIRGDHNYMSFSHIRIFIYHRPTEKKKRRRKKQKSIYMQRGNRYL